MYRIIVYCFFILIWQILTLSHAFAWKLPLEVSTTADDGSKVYNKLVIGTDSGATEGFDNMWDTPALISHPDPDNPVLLRSFINGSGDGEFRRLWKDIRGEAKEGSTTWDITVESVPEGREIVIMWDMPQSLLKKGERLALIDNGKVGNDGHPVQVDVTQVSDYTFMSGGEEARSLSLVLSKESASGSSRSGSGFGCGTTGPHNGGSPGGGASSAGVLVLFSPLVLMRVLRLAAAASR